MFNIDAEPSVLALNAMCLDIVYVTVFLLLLYGGWNAFLYLRENA